MLEEETIITTTENGSYKFDIGLGSNCTDKK